MTFGPSGGADGAISDETVGEHSALLGDDSSHGHPHGYQRGLLSESAVWLKRGFAFANSRTGRGVFKCSIAYVLGSLATFIPQIAALLGQQDGKHMVATITVYFHPARSIGSMFEAIICAIVAFLYAVFICFSSMGVSIFFDDTLHNIVLGHVLVLIIFCGGGLGLVGWTKQSMSHPLVNISCSLTSLAIITVLTKEGAVQAGEFSDDKVTQVMLMIAMGVLATTAVSFLVWPVSARTDLKNDITQITDSFGDLLAIITQAFLAGSEEILRQPAYREAENKNKKLYTSLTKNLKEAQYEHYVVGTEREYHLAAKLVNCMQRLSQNVGGLRSAATTQFLLVAQSPSSGLSETSTVKRSKKTKDSTNSHTGPEQGFSDEDLNISASPTELSLPMSHASSPTSLGHPFFEPSESNSSMSSPDDIFSTFIAQLGPSMVSLLFWERKLC